MSSKLILLFVLFTLTALVFKVDARGGRGRSGGGGVFFRRSHKKRGSSIGSHKQSNKVLTGSPVHTTYTKHGRLGHTKARNDHKRQNGKSDYHHNMPSHVHHQWAGHPLPPNHVFVSQPSHIPTNAVYYAQPPISSSRSDDSSDFALGYLIGSHITRRRHHQDHSHSHSYTTQATGISDSNISAAVEQTHYWPTDSDVPLAPLDETLTSPNKAMLNSTTLPTIFKGKSILSAQTLTVHNSTFELPAATAAPPPVENPPENGIMCMPWTFDERDPVNEELTVRVEKTICFPAPPAPSTTPAPTTTTTPAAPVAGDIEECDYAKCSTETVPTFCCLEKQIDDIYKILKRKH